MYAPIKDLCYNYDNHRIHRLWFVDMLAMNTAADLLWRVNNEYQKRLKQTRTYLGLLEQLMLMQHQDSATLSLLRSALEQVDALLEEHRTWRHDYYYESLDTRRMVTSHGAINRALANFSQMRSRHEYELQRLRALLVRLQRPDPVLTRVPTGDLWVMAEFAVQDLSSFSDYMRSLGSAHPG